MQILLTLRDEDVHVVGGYVHEVSSLEDVVDVGRRHPEDCALVIRHNTIYIDKIQVVKD